VTLVDGFRVEEVGPGAWAAIAIPDLGAVGNAGIVDLGDGALVFDTMVTPRAGRALRAHAERLVGPVGHIVNSHWHGDHRMGNGAFDPDTPILATPRTRELIATIGVERLEATKRAGREGYEPLLDDFRARGRTDEIELVEDFLRELPQIEQRLPDETFEERRDLGACEVATFGGGHTESDAFLLCRDAGILFAADLVVVRSHAWVGDGDVDSWRGSSTGCGARVRRARPRPRAGRLACRRRRDGRIPRRLARGGTDGRCDAGPLPRLGPRERVGQERRGAHGIARGRLL